METTTEAYPWIALALAVLIPIIIIGISVFILEVVALWFVLEKAGEPGWAAIIPIYNYLMVIKIAGKPWWFILMMLIPLVNIVICIIILNGLSKSFGKDEAFTVGLVFLHFIFLPILGFGKAQYSGDKSNFS